MSYINCEHQLNSVTWCMRIVALNGGVNEQTQLLIRFVSPLEST